MTISRRSFFKLMAGSGAAGAALAAGLPDKAEAAHDFSGYQDRNAVLFDASLCIGCRSCEAACNEVNKLPAVDKDGNTKDFDDQGVFNRKRHMDYSSYTVVNRFGKEETGGAETFIKKQCMHCDEPACFAACLAKAFEKTPQGAVVYSSFKCIGCRYCMQACPFEVPTYEYHNAWTPKVSKCTMCYDHIQAGKRQVPGCVEACPQEALIYGKRSDLLQIAHRRVDAPDSGYVNHIYGESEVGGTCWLYISKTPFEKLGFPHLGTTPLPKLTYGYLATIPVMHIGLPVLLAGFYLLTKGVPKAHRDQEGKGVHQ